MSRTMTDLPKQTTSFNMTLRHSSSSQHFLISTKGKYPFYFVQTLISKSPQALGGASYQLAIIRLNYLLDTPGYCDIYETKASN